MSTQTQRGGYALKCKVSRGLFSDERGVAVALPGQPVVAFVDRRDVIVPRDPGPEEEIDGWVKVDVVSLEADSALVDLPQPAVSQGTRLRVPRTMLRYNEAA